MAEIQLLSEVNADYIHLRDLLAKEDWVEADAETARLIVTISGKNKTDYESLRIEDIEQFPCTDLCTIDSLWQYYSDHKFGFSIQNRKWKEICHQGRTKANFFAFDELVTDLGWWVPSEGWLTFDPIEGLEEVPQGYFPRWGLWICRFTEEVVWKPGLNGQIIYFRSPVRLQFTRIPLRVNDFLLLNYIKHDIPVVKSFFARLESCEIQQKTIEAINAVKQNQNTQAIITPTVTLENEELKSLSEQLDVKGDFIPKSREEVKERILTSIARRQGQPKFRKDLLNVYNYRCAVTECDAEEALEAAHIIPYCETEDHAIYNGLLLRADIHTLFDLNLIAIAPGDNYPNDRESLTVQVAPNLRHTSYGELHNRSIKNLPKNQSDLPYRDFLILRCQQCDWFIEQKQPI